MSIKNEANLLKKQIEDLRKYLETAYNQKNIPYEEIVLLSQRLDLLIVQFLEYQKSP
ncbi:MAG: aspartyl-phosphate phosphatase Spo0E family protein [Clostridiaceae bacterium]|nr:aspartyl-phosphate phosphatase Spo0E family protein [Clostridiaceae bacterium]